MEGVISAADQQGMVSLFLEIAVGQTAETARQFLQASSWRLEEAIQLFYVGNEGGTAPSSVYPPPVENDFPPHDSNTSEWDKDSTDPDWGQVEGDNLRPPLPVKRDVLYDSPPVYGTTRMVGSSHGTHSVVPFRNFEEEMKRRRVWETDQGSSSSVTTKTQDNLASLYRPPFALMFHGPFEKAKDHAQMQNKWLLVNMQSTKEFSSHMLNRDTWANEAVAQTVKTNFIFWQAYDDTEEGSKVCTYYKLDSIPVILVIDSITGQKLRSWSGMVQPESLLEDLLPFLDGSPSDQHISLSHKRPRESSKTPISHVDEIPDGSNEDGELQRALAASMENNEFNGGAVKEMDDANVEDKVKKPAYLPLPEEPKGDKNLLCRVGVRLPDGRRVQRNFLRTDSVQLLWSFCHSELEKDGKGTQPFCLTRAIPGASKTLDSSSNSTFEESGLGNTMVSVTWE